MPPPVPRSHLHSKALLLLPQAAVGPQQTLEMLPHLHSLLQVRGPQSRGRAESWLSSPALTQGAQPWVSVPGWPRTAPRPPGPASCPSRSGGWGSGSQAFLGLSTWIHHTEPARESQGGVHFLTHLSHHGSANRPLGSALCMTSRVRPL